MPAPADEAPPAPQGAEGARPPPAEGAEVHQPPSGHTVLFNWDPLHFDRLVEVGARDESVLAVIPYLPRDKLLLEAGCGMGNKVAIFQSLGFRIEGVELSAPIVAQMNSLKPDLRLRVGDIGRMDVPDGHYGGLLSFGIVEHFKGGPAGPLAEHYRVLSKGGVALIMVPSLNLVRRWKRRWYRATAFLRPSLNSWLRRLTGRAPVRLNIRGRDGFIYEVNPLRGEFFEFWLTREEFEAEVRNAGFEILLSRPTHHAVCLWEDLGAWAGTNERQEFTPTLLGRVVQALLGGRGWAHNAMHMIIARK